MQFAEKEFFQWWKHKFCLIKPEATRHVPEITALTESWKFVIVEPLWIEWKSYTLTKDVMRSIYPGAPEAIITETARRFTKQRTLCFKVVGLDAVRRFAEVAGLALEPPLCAAGTLRRKFGSSEPFDFEVDGRSYRYWANGVHRSTTREEAARDIRIFYEKTGALA